MSWRIYRKQFILAVCRSAKRINNRDTRSRSGHSSSVAHWPHSRSCRPLATAFDRRQRRLQFLPPWRRNNAGTVRWTEQPVRWTEPGLGRDETAGGRRRRRRRPRRGIVNFVRSVCTRFYYSNGIHLASVDTRSGPCRAPTRGDGLRRRRWTVIKDQCGNDDRANMICRIIARASELRGRPARPRIPPTTINSQLTSQETVSGHSGDSASISELGQLGTPLEADGRSRFRVDKWVEQVSSLVTGNLTTDQLTKYTLWFDNFITALHGMQTRSSDKN